MFGNRVPSTNVAAVGILTAALVVAFLLVKRNWTAPPSFTATSVPADTATIRTEVVFIYIGDANCGACQSDEFTTALESTVVGLREYVVARGDLFRAVGVIVTPDMRRGYEYLRKHGRWDEISLGGGWHNTLVVQNVWNGESRGEVPQIVAYTQRVHRGRGVLLASDRSRLVTVVGALTLKAIADGEDWAQLLPP